MKRIRPSVRPARSQLRFDALEDRLLLSVLAGSPPLVGGAGPTATQSGTVVSSSPSDSSQATDTSSTGTTICPLTGATISSVDLGGASVPVVVIANMTQAPSANSIAPGIATAGLVPARPIDVTSLAGGEALAEDDAAPAPIQADAQSSNSAVKVVFGNSDEPELSWVDASAAQDRDPATPPALFAQADDSGAGRAALAYQLAPEFQPLDDSSPFLVAMLTSIPVQRWKPEASRAESSVSCSTLMQVRGEQVDSMKSPAAGTEESPTTSHAAEAAPDAVLQITADDAAANVDEGDGYTFEVSWHQAPKIAIPVAGLVFAFSFCRAQWPSEERTSGRKPRRKSLQPT
jgi:hypothetical protein